MSVWRVTAVSLAAAVMTTTLARPVHAQTSEAQGTAEAVNRFVAEARPLLADAAPANMVLLRGFDQRVARSDIPFEHRAQPRIHVRRAFRDPAELQRPCCGSWCRNPGGWSVRRQDAEQERRRDFLRRLGRRESWW